MAFHKVPAVVTREISGHRNYPCRFDCPIQKRSKTSALSIFNADGRQIKFKNLIINDRGAR